MTDSPAIPSDLAALGWHWNERGYLESGDRLVVIMWEAPRCFDAARTMAEVGARLEKNRKPKQERMEL